MIVHTIIQNESRHSVDLDKTIETMILIKNNALHYSVSFQDIVKTLSSEMQDCSLDYFRKFLLFLPDVPPPQAWETAVLQSDAVLTKKEKKEVIAFGCGLCSCSREQIAELSEKCISTLESCRMQLYEGKEKRIKTATALSLSTGLIIVLIFI